MIIADELKSFSYYRNKLPMYLQQAEGFDEHFRIWYDLLVGENSEPNPYGVVGFGDTIFALLNIFDIDYLVKFPDAENKTLDLIGKLFGVSRSFDVQYTKLGVQYREHLDLNNEEFLILIKTQIINNYCNGTQKQISNYYREANLPIYAITHTPGSAEVDLYLSRVLSDNIMAMYWAGMLTIKSVGISYNYYLYLAEEVLFWDADLGWDDANWW